MLKNVYHIPRKISNWKRGHGVWESKNPCESRIFTEMNTFVWIEIHLKHERQPKNNKRTQTQPFVLHLYAILWKHGTMGPCWANTTNTASHMNKQTEKSDELLMNYLYHQRGEKKTRDLSFNFISFLYQFFASHGIQIFCVMYLECVIQRKKQQWLIGSGGMLVVEQQQQKAATNLNEMQCQAEYKKNVCLFLSTTMKNIDHEKELNLVTNARF